MTLIGSSPIKDITGDVVSGGGDGGVGLGSGGLFPPAPPNKIIGAGAGGVILFTTWLASDVEIVGSVF